MLADKPLTIHSRNNFACSEYQLPTSLLHDLMQQMNAYGLASEQLFDAINPLLEKDTSLKQSWSLMSNAMKAQEHLLDSLRRYWHLRNAAPPTQFRPVELGKIGDSLRERVTDNFPEIFFTQEGFNNFVVSTQSTILLELLSCIVDNACINAKYRVEITAEAEGACVRIEVRDDGNGLHPDILNSIGMPFIRNPTPIPNKKKGLGLGIYIAAKNAEALSARLDVLSTPGQGCIFSVTLPLSNSLGLATMTLDDIDPISGARIMLIQPPPHTEELIKILNSLKCKIDHFNTWDTSSIKALGSTNYDALIINQKELSENQASISQAIRSLPNTCPATFIFIEEQSSPRVAEEEKRYPAIHILRPPLKPSRLRSVLSHGLRQRTKED